MTGRIFPCFIKCTKNIYFILFHSDKTLSAINKIILYVKTATVKNMKANQFTKNRPQHINLQ